MGPRGADLPSSHASSVGAGLKHERRAVSVLVVEDDRETRELISTLLRTAGYSVRNARNGQEALQLLQWICPAVILLDIQMPIMDGYQFREAQRRDPELVGIATVVMTADPGAEPLLDPGVEQALRKPIKLFDILAVVKRYCGPGVP